MTYLRQIAASVLTLILAVGCGASDSSSGVANEEAPVANAGVAQNVTTGTLVTLDGSASSDANADPLTYSWTLTSRPAGSAAVLSGTNSAAPTFTADVAGTYVASLVVNDGKISSTASTVAIAATIAPVSVLAVGDIAQCGSQPAADSAAAKTAAIVAQQSSDTPLLLLGDLVYDSGTLAEYLNCYEPTYGKFMARSFPAPGNHDYGVPAGDDYYAYFGARAGPDKRGYYSFDVGSWHVISLNSNIDMAKGSAQEAWLRADLMAASNKKCTLAYWHHARFSSSSSHGNDPRSSDIWRVLFEFNADVVLVGHDHTYERFAPQDPEANADPAKGIRQFVIGTGGAALYQFGTPQPNSEARGAGSFGVAKFVLADGRYSWEFLPAAGSTFTDRGESKCVE